MLKKSYCPSPIGWFEITGSEFGVRSVKRCEQEGESDVLPAEHPVVICRQQLQEYFDGSRRYFDIRLDWSGAPDFYLEVWKIVKDIPYGQTMAYSEIAEILNQPKAVRAVGMANRNNPCAIIVPCHRVIGKAGELRGYFYGLDTKMTLLRHENPVRFAEQTSLF